MVIFQKYTILIIYLLTIQSCLGQDDNSFLRKDGAQLALTEAGASHFSNLAYSCLQQEYPNKLNQVLKTEKDLQSPKTLHPAFYGCFDWHSSVHGHWMLVQLLKEYPNLENANAIMQKLDENFQTENIKAEVAYFNTASKSWERMYGWSWLMKLSEALYLWDDPQAKIWYNNLKPLTDAIIERYLQFLEIQEYPVRTGVHPNTAFGLSFAYEYALATDHAALKAIIEKRASDYYSNDANCPASWEPSGEDFLSACLEEARLMSLILRPTEFEKWFDAFLPEAQLKHLLVPADVADRSDPKIVHLDGLNLSRAWCMYLISNKISNKNKQQLLNESAAKHLYVTVPNIASEHYEGSHWLASFVVYALSID